MNQRTTPYITIKRYTTYPSSTETVATVLITEKCRRKFTLMSEDSITLVFSLDTAVKIKIGDFIDDELFGRFYVTKEQMPKFNNTTGGYDYSIAFDAEYMLWRNWICCLVAVMRQAIVGTATLTTVNNGDPFSESNLVSQLNNYYSDWQYNDCDVAVKELIVAKNGYDYTQEVEITQQMCQSLNSIGTDYDADGKNMFYLEDFTQTSVLTTKERKEINWRLTDNLASHANQICDNLACLGQGQWTASVTAEKAAEAKYIAYSGISMLDALNAIADAYECEWWVTTDDKTIHFGKCEGSNTAMEFQLGANVQTMDIQDNRNTFGNRFYVYGGTRNIPTTYDRRLTFKCDKTATVNSRFLFVDSTRLLTLDMIGGDATGFPTITITPGTKTATSTAYSATKVETLNPAKYSINGFYTFSIWWNDFNYNPGDTPAVLDYTFKVYLKVDSGTRRLIGSQSGSMTANSSPNYTRDTLTINVPQQQIDVEESLEVYLETTGNFSVGTIEESETVFGGSVTLQATSSKQAQKELTLTYEGTDYDVLFNPLFEDIGSDYYSWFEFLDDAPNDFGIGSEFTLSPLTIKVDASYYTTTNYDDPSAISKIGERRLHIPRTQHGVPVPPYLDAFSLADKCVNVVEQAIVFDDIYPKLMLVITNIKTKACVDVVEYEDGSRREWGWTEYSFECEKINGYPFVFSTDYILEGNKLEAVFVTPDEERAAADNPSSYTPSGSYRLAGMTFEVGFRNDAQLYTIIRNENFGAKLPSTELPPAVGDAFVLVGWNPMAMSSLGLVEDAENKLLQKGDDYCDAVEQGQFTFTCHMMSEWPFTFISDIPLHTSADEPVEVTTNSGSWFYVQNDQSAFRLPIEGAKVTIIHNALPSNKTSRVIGYEFKLDMPWDSPTYVIGETQAFSRLAKLEKEITKLS